MGKNSDISWTTHSFSPWWGCVEVSPACDNCYARELDKRFPVNGVTHWGKDAPRRFFGEKHWRQPLNWNRAAEKSGERARVFCLSMGDICERRDDLDAERLKLWPLIEATPWLDWLLLTKRPNDFERVLPDQWLESPRENVWLMTTIESPGYYWRWHHLKKVPAAIRGISYEPALEEISVGDLVAAGGPKPDWIIAGSESGSKARQAKDDWYRALAYQCYQRHIAFHMKQICDRGKPIDFAEFPGDLQVRQYPLASLPLVRL